MAISSSTRKAGPFLGNDATTVFPFAFKVFTAADLLVVNTSALGVESDLELDVDYTVSLNANQDSDPGGSVTRLAALPTGERLTITSDVAALQPLVLTNNGGFYPNVINDAFDKITIIAQQLIEQVGRSLKLPISSTASATLPDPVPNSILAWNSDADGFVNIDPTDLATVSGYADARVEVYNGDGVETEFEIDFNPGVLANLDISISGVTQVAGVDFTWIGTTVTFTAAPPNGTVIQVRYARPLSPPPALDAAVDAAEAAAVAAAADRVQTGLDRVATDADAEATAADRVAAEAAADRAEADRVIATGLANMWPDTIIGLANTAADGYFSTPADGTGRITVYQDQAGVAVPVYYDYVLAEDIVGRAVAPFGLTRLVPPGLRPHRDLLSLLAGTTNQCGIMYVGDSLSDTSWETCGTQAQRNIANWMPTSPVWAVSGSNILGFTAPTGITLGAGTIYPISGKYTGTYHVKTRYDLAFDGTAMELAAGQYCVFAYGGQTLYGDYLLIPLITGPTGGIVRVRYSTVAVPLAASTWYDPTAPQIVSSGHALTGAELRVDTYSATPGLTMVRLNIGTIGPLGVRLDHVSGGSVFSLKCQTAVKTASSIPTYRISSPSNDFIYADMDCAPIMGALIAELNYTFLWVASDDTVDSTLGDPSTGEPYAAYATFLPVLEAAIEASGLAYPPHVILECNPYLSNGAYRTDAELAASTDYRWTWCQSRVGWDVLDMLAMTGGLAPTVAGGLNGDSSPWLHYNGTLARIATDRFWASRGWDAPQGRRPGGDATTGNILLGKNTNVVNAETVMDALAAPTFHTGSLTWAGVATSGGSSTLHTANTGLRLATSTAVGGAVRAHINVAQSPLGKNQGNIGAEVRRVGFRCRLVTTSADAVFYALFRSGGSYNSAAAGALTAAGYGFRVVNSTIVGTCWGNLAGSSATAALVLSTDVGVAQNGGSVAMVTGGAADYVDCQIRLFPGEVSLSRGRIQWWVNGVIIGEASYAHASTLHWGYELMSTNGATTSFTADVSFPVFVSSSVTAD